MILNKNDLKHLINEIKDIRFCLKCHGIRGCVRWYEACITDYIFYGGMTCNKHNKWLCRKYKSNRLSYKPKIQ